MMRAAAFGQVECCALLHLRAALPPDADTEREDAAAVAPPPEAAADDDDDGAHGGELPPPFGAGVAPPRILPVERRSAGDSPRRASLRRLYSPS